MPKSGTSSDYVAKVEDHIAAIIAGRFALIDLEVMVASALRKSDMPQREKEDILRLLSQVGRAVDLGHEYARIRRGEI